MDLDEPVLLCNYGLYVNYKDINNVLLNSYLNIEENGGLVYTSGESPSLKYWSIQLYVKARSNKKK